MKNEYHIRDSTSIIKVKFKGGGAPLMGAVQSWADVKKWVLISNACVGKYICGALDWV